MSEVYIEQSGMHTASQTLVEAQRELQRELDKDAGRNSLIKSSAAAAPAGGNNAVAVAARSSNSSAAVERVEGDAAARGTVSNPNDGRGPSDYTIRQMNPPPPAPLVVLRGEPEEGCVVTAEDGVKDVKRMLCQSDATEDVVGMKRVDSESWMDEDERAATEFVKRFPARKGEFLQILKTLRRQRHERESLLSLEDLARGALADVWSLQWEALYEAGLASRKRAADDMRARLSRVHWRERLEVRRQEMMQRLEDRQTEEIFHEAKILRELEMKRYLEWWNEQLASFADLPLLLTGGEEIPAIEAAPASA